MKSDFQQKLEAVTFKTGLHNQEIGYADLFENKRVVIFATPKPINGTAWHVLKAYDAQYEEIKMLGIDEVYCVSSDTLLIPYMDKHTQKIVPIVDFNLGFVSLMQRYAGRNSNVLELSRMWEYSVIINNGSVEKFFSNPLKENMPLSVYVHEKYRFNGLWPAYILTHLNGNIAQR